MTVPTPEEVRAQVAARVAEEEAVKSSWRRSGVAND
jgi:hypothetical protein